MLSADEEQSVEDIHRPVEIGDLAVLVKGKVPEEEEEELYRSYKEILIELWEIGHPIKILKRRWRNLIAEFLGTAILVFFGTATVVSSTTISGLNSGAIVAVSLAFGIAGATAIYATAAVSGGHINPAVSIGMFVAMKISFFQCLFYVLAQIAGGILGSAFVKGVMPEEMAESVKYGATTLATDRPWSTGKAQGISSVSVGQGVLFEIVFTFTLVLTVLATVKLPREKSNMGQLAPLAIGFAILIGHLVGVPFTGPSLNPARSFGPAVISGYWQHHWVYWVGPIVGGIFAGIIYKYFFIRPLSVEETERLAKARAMRRKRSLGFGRKGSEAPPPPPAMESAA